MIGIYKITSPSNKVYIGQSVNIQKRFRDYKSLKRSIKQQPKLYNSFVKYGVDNHLFEILSECTKEELNILERYFQDMYNAISRKGLNCRLTGYADRCGEFSVEYKQKFTGSGNPFYGKKHTEESRLKISKSNTGKKRPEHSKALSGANHFFYGKKRPECSGINNVNSKKVININTLKVFNSIIEAYNEYSINNKMPYPTFKSKLNLKTATKKDLHFMKIEDYNKIKNI
jgi:group I intron endonuclease